MRGVKNSCFMIVVFKVSGIKYFAGKLEFNQQLVQLYNLCLPSFIVLTHWMLINLKYKPANYYIFGVLF